MHDFRDVEDEEAQTEMTQFLKNIGLTTGALAFLALSGVAWLHTRYRRLTPPLGVPTADPMDERPVEHQNRSRTRLRGSDGSTNEGALLLRMVAQFRT
jgi:hypothetical protein